MAEPRADRCGPLELQRQALEWFERSLQQPAAQRDAWLNLHCRTPSVRERVRQLQAADDDAGDFLASPHKLASEGTVAPGTRVGPWCVDGLLASGGMGSVHLAHRDDGHYSLQVAIKFLHPLLRDPEAGRRFAAERQILANLQHPNIAQMLDAGSTSDGTPYVVMEFIDGEPITSYCTRHKSSLVQRLKIFREVCSAVAAAHRALVVHRDLKPGNILVTADARPMLLDFGIAKVLQEGPDRSLATTVVAMTPAYASPEQIQRLAITTSSDIYSLGVLLYELLTGCRPYELEGLTPAQAELLVCDTLPVPPSQAHARPGAGDAGPVPSRTLRGDLDVITLKALRKEPERRYGSVQELSEDVHRYLRGLPINARRDSLGYRMGKFVRRNRWAAAAAALVLASLIGGMLTTHWQARRAQQQAALAESQRARAEQINAFYKTLLMAPSSQWISSIRKGPTVTMAEVLGIAAQRADAELASQPDIHADVLTSITQAYVGMGLYDMAITTGRRALQIVQAHLPADNRLQVDARYQLARALDLKGDYAAGERLYRQAIDRGKRILPADSQTLALLYNDLAMMHASQNRLSQAETELRKALDLHRTRLNGRADPAMAIGLNNLGVIRTQRGDLDGAMQAYEASLAMFSQLRGHEYAENANLLSNMSVVHVIRGEWPQARRTAHDAVAMGRRLLGEDNPNYAVFLIHMADADIGSGQMDGVQASLDSAREILSRRVAKAHIYQVWLNTSYGAWHLRGQRLGQAQQALRKARTLYLQTRSDSGSGQPSHSYALIQGLLGETLLAEGEPRQAQPLLEEALRLNTALYGEDVAEVQRFRELLTRARQAADGASGQSPDSRHL